jgi:hypothetical protein
VIESLQEREANYLAETLRLAFGTPERLAEFLHQNYRATDKSLNGNSKHDHGFITCHHKGYFIRRAKWLMQTRHHFNGRVKS